MNKVPIVHFARPDGTPSARACNKSKQYGNRGHYSPNCREVSCYSCLCKMTSDQLKAAVEEGATKFIRARAERVAENREPMSR